MWQPRHLNWPVNSVNPTRNFWQMLLLKVPHFMCFQIRQRFASHKQSSLFLIIIIHLSLYFWNWSAIEAHCMCMSGTHNHYKYLMLNQQCMQAGFLTMAHWEKSLLQHILERLFANVQSNHQYFHARYFKSVFHKFVSSNWCCKS